MLGDDIDLCPKGIAFTCRKGFWAALADMCLLTQRSCKGLKPESPNQDSWCLLKMDSFIGFTDMGGCQNYDPFLGTLNIRCHIIIRVQKEP